MLQLALHSVASSDHGSIWFQQQTVESPGHNYPSNKGAVSSPAGTNRIIKCYSHEL